MAVGFALQSGYAVYTPAVLRSARSHLLAPRGPTFHPAIRVGVGGSSLCFEMRLSRVLFNG